MKNLRRAVSSKILDCYVSHGYKYMPSFVVLIYSDEGILLVHPNWYQSIK